MSITLPAVPVGPPGLDFEALRGEGVARLQELVGDSWTDYNSTDPGVTLLEALCYAITDLTYRAGHSIPDLVSERGSVADFPTASTVLSCAPVSLNDLRSLVLDVDGVRNAWVSVVDSALPTYFAAGSEQIGFRPDPPATEPLRVGGLLEVAIEKSDTTSLTADAVRKAVVTRLLGWRNVGTDFETVRVLAPQPVTVTATVEVDVLDQPADVLAAIYDVAAEYFSPTLGFRSLPDLLAAGVATDDIFLGPQLTHGFLDPADLARYERRAIARGSDLIAAITALPGVRVVRDLTMSSTGTSDPWALALDPAAAPRLDFDGSVIQLVRGTSGVDVDPGPVRASVTAARAARERAARSGGSAGGLDLPLPVGRSRDVASLPSVRHDLPRTYGVGDDGLEPTVPPARHAAAQQLQAYLLFFDQVLAGMATQLAAVGDLLAPGTSNPVTYAAPAPPEAGQVEVLMDPAHYVSAVAALTRDIAGDTSAARRNRFLSHLLARQGEDLPDTGGDPVRAAGDKARLLPVLPALAARRGQGSNYLTAASADGGLLERVRAKLGLVAAEGEDLLLIEHVLLRPVAPDVAPDDLPLLEAVDGDPYSFQVTWVLPEAPLRFAPGSFRSLLLSTLRAETPAHLRLRTAWADADTFAQLRTAYEELLAARGRTWDLG